MKLPSPILAALFALAAGVPAAAQTAVLFDLPLLPTPVGFSVSPHVVSINAAGDVVGTIYFSRKPCLHCPTQTITRSFLVSNGVATQSGPDGFVISASNDLGDIVGNLRDPADSLLYPYLIHGGVFTQLSTAPATVMDINNLGEVSYLPAISDWGFQAAMMSDGEHGLHAFKFAGTLPTNDLSCGTPSPDYECMTGYSTGFDFVTDINNGTTIADAMAVGGDRDNPWSSSYGRQHAFVGYRGQTTLLSAGFTAAAQSVNDHGVIAGYDDGLAVLWLPTSAGAWREVSVASLVNDATWVCREADAVNNAGLVAGIGTHNGFAAAFLLALSPRRPVPGDGYVRVR